MSFKTTAAVSAGVVGYTVEAYSYKKRKATPPQKVSRAKGSDSFEIVVPTGSAGAMPGLITKASDQPRWERGWRGRGAGPGASKKCRS